MSTDLVSRDLRWGLVVLPPAARLTPGVQLPRATSTGTLPSCWATVVLEAWGSPPYIGESEPFFAESCPIPGLLIG